MESWQRLHQIVYNLFDCPSETRHLIFACKWLSFWIIASFFSSRLRVLFCWALPKIKMEKIKKYKKKIASSGFKKRKTAPKRRPWRPTLRLLDIVTEWALSDVTWPCLKGLIWTRSWDRVWRHGHLGPAKIHVLRDVVNYVRRCHGCRMSFHPRLQCDQGRSWPRAMTDALECLSKHEKHFKAFCLSRPRWTWLEMARVECRP